MSQDVGSVVYKVPDFLFGDGLPVCFVMVAECVVRHAIVVGPTLPHRSPPRPPWVAKWGSTATLGL
jgi:hypothetical protein